jgi:hypothetical protein
MVNLMARLFDDVHPSKAKLTLFLDSKCFLIASTVRVYSLRQMFYRVMGDGGTNSLRNVWYDRRSCLFNVAFHGISAETNPNMG